MLSGGYDGNGTPAGYTADVNGQLIGFNDPYGTQAGYRDDGLRAWKQSARNLYGFAERTYFLYDGTRVIYATGQEAGAYGYGATGLVQSDLHFVSPPILYPSGVCSYVFDPMGNAVSRIYLSGQSAKQMYDLAAYDAFGQFADYINPQGNNFPFNPNPLLPPDGVGYGGQWGNYTDLETGLVLMGYRYYSPVQGRFLTRDPIGHEGGINPYAYCRNNPINAADPDGTDWTWQDKAHLALGIASLIPGVGQVASGIDAGLYLSEGKYGMAALSATGMIPGAAYAKLATKLLMAGKDVKLLAAATQVSAKLLTAGKDVKLLTAAEDTAKLSGKTVWDFIKGTQSVYPGTTLPRSFEMYHSNNPR